MTDYFDPKAIADELRAGCGNGCKTASSVMHCAADTIDALVKERDEAIRQRSDIVKVNTSLKQRIRSTERERDALAAVVEKLGVVAKNCPSITTVDAILSTAPEDALAEHDARLMEELADTIAQGWRVDLDRLWKTNQNELWVAWLRERARLIREGDKK